MSGMELTKDKDERLSESRAIIREAMSMDMRLRNYNAVVEN